jgi:hypothetical protein
MGMKTNIFSEWLLARGYSSLATGLLTLKREEGFAFS